MLNRSKEMRKLMVEFSKFTKEMGIIPRRYGVQKHVFILEDGSNCVIRTSPFNLEYDAEDRIIIVDFDSKKNKNDICGGIQCYNIIFVSKTGETGENKFAYTFVDDIKHKTEELSLEECEKINDLYREENLQNLIHFWSYALYGYGHDE